MITEEFKKIMDKDIEDIYSIICNDPEEQKSPSFFEMFCRIRSKYNGIIVSFDEQLITNRERWAYKRNLIILKDKLELFKAMGYENAKKVQSNQQPISISNINNNTNNVDINISFEQVRKDIECMSSLPDSEIEEILQKISELEKIVQSKNRKSKKWENAKHIIKWVADKGVDVGISILPLLLQIK